MATNIIKIKRTTGTTAPGSLNAGELAFSGGAGTQGNLGQRLFIGDVANSNAVTVIGGNYFSNLMDHVHGTTTASSGLIVDANKSATEIRTAALYLGTSGSDTLVSSTAAELNLLDGSSANSVVNSKAVIYGSSGEVAGTLSTAAQASVTSVGTLTALTVDDVAINGKVVTMTGSSGDTAVLTVGTNGTLAITTVDTAAAAANMTLTADGTFEAVGTTITLDSGGAINLEPAAGSAILLDGTISVDAGVITNATSITSTAFVGAVTGNADTATLATTATNVTASANNSTNETVYPTFVDGATSGQGIETDTGLFYNPSTGLFTTAGLDISGDIDVDGTTNLDNTDIDGSLTVDGAVDINATTFDIDASDDIDIDTTDTTGGIAIGTATSGVPITLGHGTSETTVGDNLTVTGNLTVSGTTTTVNSTVVTIADPIFEMGVSGSDDNLDRGIKMKYNSSGAKLAFMGYDDSDGKFAFIPDATDSSSVFSGTQGTLKANIEASATGIKVGDSVPFSDSSGTLTLTNIDALDATTEATIEAAIDTLSNLTTVGTIGSGTWEGTTVAVAQGGTALTAASTSGFVMTSNGSGFVMQSIDGGTYS